MAVEDAVSAGEPDRLAACVRAVGRYLDDELGALVRTARKSLILDAHDSLDREEEERLIALVAEVETHAPVAGNAFRSAVLARLKAPDEGSSDDPSRDESSALTLVDTGKVDDLLRMREIVERHPDEAKALEAGLHRRLAMAAGTSSNPDSAPVSVPGMCALFQASMRSLGAGPEARAAIYDAFEATVVARLGVLVEHLYRILDGATLPEELSLGAEPAQAGAGSIPVPGRGRRGDAPGPEPDTRQPAVDSAPGHEPEQREPSVLPGRLLGAIAAVERQMLEVSPGRGLAALSELEARLADALTPPGAVLSEPELRAVGAVAALVHQAFAHPGIEPAVRARLWKLAPPMALLALQGDDQLDLVLQATRHDPVTGLLDRAAFRARLEAALAGAARSGRGCAVCIVEVDGFKELGQRLGQQVAGRLLRVLAGLLRRYAGAPAQLARLRGAEFGILLPARHPDSGWRFASRYLSEVNKAHFAVSGHAVALTVSIGVVESDPTLTTVEQVMRAVDAAHTSAKEDGGGCARVHIPEGFG